MRGRWGIVGEKDGRQKGETRAEGRKKKCKGGGKYWERRMGERKVRQGLGETKISEREVGNGGGEGWEKER